MAAQIQTYQTEVGSKFSGIKVGDAVGSVDGPGVNPTYNNLGVVLGFGEDDFYEYVVVQRADGDLDKVIGFTNIGIGHYHLPTYLFEQQSKM